MPAHQQMVRGGFAVQRSVSSSFSQVAIDQVLEQSVNKDTKTAGGIIGFSLSPGAVERWMLTAHLRGAFTAVCDHVAGVTMIEHTHRALLPSPVAKSVEAVQKVLTHLSSWSNPFAHSDELFSLSSGVQASQAVADDLLAAKEKGRKALVAFFNDRLLSTKVGFFDTLHSLNLHTFFFNAAFYTDFYGTKAGGTLS